MPRDLKRRGAASARRACISRVLADRGDVHMTDSDIDKGYR
jgi:hypothetical protein